MRVYLGIGLAVLFSALASIALRYLVLEPPAMGFACAAADAPAWCAPRQGLALAIHHRVIGGAAVIVAALALFNRSGLLTAGAGMLAVAGLVLYNVDLAAPALIMATAAAARLSPPTRPARLQKR